MFWVHQTSRDSLLTRPFHSFADQPKTITLIPSKAIPAPVQSKIERFLTVHNLQPDESCCYINTAIGRIDSSAGGVMKREEPRKDSQTERCRNQKPD